MSNPIASRLQELSGSAEVTRSPDGLPRIAPRSSETMARVLALAAGEGWSIRLEGRGSWCPSDAPADLIVTTIAMDRVVAVAPHDLVCTVETGVSLATLSLALGEHGMWLPWDPPGLPDRSIGSIVATGTAGALREGFGPIRDQLLGCTIVTGDGRVLKPGGIVVKNVAGYDLTKIEAGAFGAYGVLTEVNIRLRARPEIDQTHLAAGERDDLTRAARDLVGAGTEVAALELMSPALGAHANWTLAARILGPPELVRGEATRLHELTTLNWVEVTEAQARSLWHRAARGTLTGPVSIRLGVLIEGLDQTIDLLEERLDTGLLSAGAGSGTLRWSGNATADDLSLVRRIAASREIPVTLERAPWDLRQAVGHFGAYREGVGGLVEKLRDVFDPARVMRVALEGAGSDEAGG